jgi:hypothetical protein
VAPLDTYKDICKLFKYSLLSARSFNNGVNAPIFGQQQITYTAIHRSRELSRVCYRK